MPRRSEIKISVVGLVLTIQILLFCLIALASKDAISIIFRAFLATLYLNLVPGLVLLHLLNADFSRLNTYLYAIGLSVVLTTWIGFLVDLLCLLLRVSSPLSEIPLLVTLTLTITPQALLSLKRKGELVISIQSRLRLSPIFCFLLLLPFLIIVSALLIRYYNNNILMIASITIIGLLPPFITFNKIPRQLYPLGIFVAFLSLLYHNLISIPYLTGADMHFEYWYVNSVYLNSYWAPSYPEHQNNSLLIEVIFSPIFSKLTGIPLTWTIKLLYPFLFSIALVALYQAFRRQIGEELAFLSCFFFASLGINYEELSGCMKHSVTVFFISLLVLLMLDKDINKVMRNFLTMAFLSGLAISHYGVPYIFLISSAFVLTTHLIGKRTKKFEANDRITTVGSISFFAILTISWFLYTSGGAGFYVVVLLCRSIINSIVEFFSPLERGGIYYLTTKLPSLEWEILRVLHIITQFFMVVGFLATLYEKVRGSKKIQDEFFLYSSAFLGWLGISIIVPAIIGGSSLGMPRMYGLSVIFLAPFFAIGGSKVLGVLCRKNTNKHDVNVKKLLAFFLFIFLLFNTRVIMELNREIFGGDRYVASLSLSQPRILIGNASPEEIVGFFKGYNSHLDVYGALWLKSSRSNDEKVVADGSFYMLIYAMIPRNDILEILDNQSWLTIIRGEQKLFIYLREYNIKFGVMAGRYHDYYNTSEVLLVLEANKVNKVYSNGGSIIFLKY